MNALQRFDEWLFLLLNGFHARGFDQLMVAVTSAYAWIPVAAILMYVSIKKLGKNALWL